MKEIILTILNDISKECGRSEDCQINFSAESARLMIAERLEEHLNKHFSNTVEEMFCAPTEDRTNENECCGGGCHGE